MYIHTQVFDSSESFEQWFSAPFDAEACLSEEEKMLVILRLHQARIYTPLLSLTRTV